jgi:hypothetical protein
VRGVVNYSHRIKSKPMTPGERIQPQVIIDVAAGRRSLNNVGTTNESLVDHFQNVQFRAESVLRPPH